MKKILIWILLVASLYAGESRGLLIGINDGLLSGTVNDVKKMKKLLQDRGVTKIKTLYNKQATKANILKYLKDIVKNSNSGDRVYFFFSGHGTSSYDPAIQKYPRVKNMLENSGGLIPWNVKPKQYEKGMISAKYDLAPLFQTLDNKGVESVIIFDACFAGSAFKDSKNYEDDRKLPIYATATRGVQDYPYKHIIYLSATTQSDYASESKKHKRGYFSMAITNCLRENQTLNNLKKCLYKQKMPQTPIIFPHKNKNLFSSNRKNKDIIVQPKRTKLLGEELFDMVIESEAFRVYAKNKIANSYFIYAKNKPDGYLALFSREDNKIKMYYPNNKTIAKLNANSNKRRLTLKTEPFLDNKTEQKEEFVGFLIDKDSAKELQIIYNQSSSDGILSKEALEKTINTLQDKGFYGSKFRIIVRKN